MDWKLIVRTSLIVGASLVVANAYAIIYDIERFYGAGFNFTFLLLVLMYSVAVSVTFLFVFRRAENRKALHALTTLAVAFVLSIILTFAVMISTVKFLEYLYGQ